MSKQNKQRFRIVSDDVMTSCVMAIMERKNAGEVVNVIITEKDETRSLAQNRLYWLWLNFIADKKGWSDKEIHLYLKRKFLALIYAQDDGEMLETIESLQVAKNTLPALYYERIARKVANGIRSSQANTKQFQEYLNRIEMWAYEQGLPPLPCPPDLKWVRDE